MPVDFPITHATLWSFALTLARVSGVLAFIPVPGWKRAPDSVKVILALTLSVALFPIWPVAPNANPSLGQLLAWLLAEMSLGLLLGLGVSFLLETFTLAAQILGLQAGYSYSSTIDPTSEADSSVLQVIAQFSACLLFFSLHIDTQILAAMGRMFVKYPPGVWMERTESLESVLRLGGLMWGTALRLALPLIALLLMVDLCLALLSRIQAQLQLLTLAFPAKMLASLVALAALTGVFPAVFRQQAERLVMEWMK